MIINKVELEGKLTNGKLQQTVRHLQLQSKNSGPHAAFNTILVMAQPPNGGKEGNPIKKLVDFQKVWLEVGQSVVLNVEITLDHLSLANREGTQVFEAGVWRFWVDEEVMECVVL